MPTIKIQRIKEFNNSMRDYKIFIDGKQVGTIAYGETKDFTTSAGKHNVTAKIDWCSSPDILIDVKENETIALNISGFKISKWLILLMLGIIVLHLILSVTIGFYMVKFLLVLPFITLIYYLTIGRKEYLVIRKT